MFYFPDVSPVKASSVEYYLLQYIRLLYIQASLLKIHE
jgi:hypothetical protein